MVVRDAGISVLIVVIIVAAMVGYVSSKRLGHDNAVEEVSEAIIEDSIEAGFKLPKDSITIDLTPSSRESD